MSMLNNEFRLNKCNPSLYEKEKEMMGDENLVKLVVFANSNKYKREREVEDDVLALIQNIGILAKTKNQG